MKIHLGSLVSRHLIYHLFELCYAFNLCSYCLVWRAYFQFIDRNKTVCRVGWVHSFRDNWDCVVNRSMRLWHWLWVGNRSAVCKQGNEAGRLGPFVLVSAFKQRLTVSPNWCQPGAVISISGVSVLYSKRLMVMWEVSTRAVHFFKVFQRVFHKAFFHASFLPLVPPLAFPILKEVPRLRNIMLLYLAGDKVISCILPFYIALFILLYIYFRVSLLKKIGTPCAIVRSVVTPLISFPSAQVTMYITKRADGLWCGAQLSVRLSR